MIDAIDRRILQALQREGRLTQLELADQVGLSPITLRAACETAGIRRLHPWLLGFDR